MGIGKTKLLGDTEGLGILDEPILCEGQKEITQFGSWRDTMAKN